MTTDYGVAGNGFILKPYSAILEEMQNNIRAAVGDDVDLADYAALGEIISSIAYTFADYWQKLEAVYYAGYLNTAASTNLDEVVTLTGLSRKTATYASGTIVYSRSTAATIAILIPAGSRVSNQDGTIIFETTEDATLAIGQYMVTVAIEAVDAGSSGNVAAGILTNMLDPISGIESVTNAAATTGGADAETDPVLRLRTRTSSPAAKATLAAIENAILAIDGVTNCKVSEDTSEHTITAVVLGGDEGMIGTAIAETRPAGIPCSMVRPTTKSVVVTASVVRSSGSDATVTHTNILAALTEYFGSLGIGEDIAYSTIASVISAADGVGSISSLSVVCGSTTLSGFGQTLAIADTELAISGSHTVTVS